MVPSATCTTPCHGVYADVEHDEDAAHVKVGTKLSKQALADYQVYKNGGQKEIKYPPALAGKNNDYSVNKNHIRISRLPNESQTSTCEYLLQKSNL